MPPHHDHKSFSSADIQKYLRGEMSAAAMHELERAALDDPFLADAIEGYSVAHGEAGFNADNDINALKKKLAQRTAQRGAVLMNRNYWWRVAAILLLLAGTGGVVYTLLNNSASDVQEIAKNDRMQPSAVSPEPAGTALNKDSTTEKFSSRYSQQRTTEKKHVDTPLSNQSAHIADDQDIASTLTKDISTQPPTQVPSLRKAEELAAARNRSLVDKTGMEKPVQEFSGKVTDAANRPVEGAMVVADKSPAPVLTDKQGNFSLKVPDTAVHVRVNAEGYEMASATLKSNAPAPSITLEARSALSGKVAGVSTRAKPGRESTAPVTIADPVGGWTAFETYISENKRLAGDEINAGGSVVLSFNINKKGRPVNIRVDSSLSTPADSEAIRLLKEGPGWIMRKQHKGKATLSIRF